MAARAAGSLRHMNERVPRWSAPVLVLAVVAGCTASASVAPAGGGTPATAAAAVTTASAERPTTEEGCKACNGIWGVHGIAATPSCNCRTTDGGRRCRDGAECQGLCLAADEPEREVVEAGPPPRGHFVGRCSNTIAVFGCSRIIDRGAMARGAVPLSDPPAQLCAD
jgi:hypothetical protein